MRINKLAMTIFLLTLWNTAQGQSNFLAPDRIEGVETIDAEKLIDLRNKNDEMVIIDSRLESDRNLGFIPYSINLPDDVTQCDTLNELIPSLQNPVVFYCNGVKCNRSTRAVTAAKLCGYERIYWLRGGMQEWKKKGFPIGYFDSDAPNTSKPKSDEKTSETTE